MTTIKQFIFFKVEDFKRKKKNPFLASLLSCLFGSIGLQKFYLKRNLVGLFYLINSMLMIITKNNFFISIWILLCLVSVIEGCYYFYIGLKHRDNKNKSINHSENSKSKKNNCSKEMLTKDSSHSIYIKNDRDSTSLQNNFEKSIPEKINEKEIKKHNQPSSEYQWWDPTGELSKQQYFSKKDKFILDVTPSRKTKRWEILEIRKVIIDLYLKLWIIIEGSLEQGLSWENNSIEHIRDILNFNYDDNDETRQFLSALIEITEKKIIEMLVTPPYVQDLKSEENTKVITSFLPTSVSLQLKEYVNIYGKQLPVEELNELSGILNKYDDNDDLEWQRYASQILSAKTETEWQQLLLEYQEIEKYDCLLNSLIEQSPNDDLVLVCLYLVGRLNKLTPAMKEKLAKIIYPSNMTLFYSYLSDPDPLNKEMFNKILSLKRQKQNKKEIKLDQKKINDSKELLNKTIVSFSETTNSTAPLSSPKQMTELEKIVNQNIRKKKQNNIKTKRATQQEYYSNKEIIIPSLNKRKEPEWQVRTKEILKAKEGEDWQQLLLDYQGIEKYDYLLDILIKQSKNDDLVLVCLYLAGRLNKLTPTMKEKLEKIIYPGNMTQFYNYLSEPDPLNKEMFDKVLSLRKQNYNQNYNYKGISLDFQKIAESEKELDETVRMVADFTSESITKTSSSKEQEEVLKNFFDRTDVSEDANTKSDVNEDSQAKDEYQDALLLIDKLIKNKYLTMDKITEIALEKGQLANAYISTINKQVFDEVNDQLIVVEDDRVKIDEYYLEKAKELVGDE